MGKKKVEDPLDNWPQVLLYKNNLQSTMKCTTALDSYIT